MSIYLITALVFVGALIGGTLTFIHVTSVLRGKSSPRPQMIWRVFSFPIFMLLFNAWLIELYTEEVLRVLMLGMFDRQPQTVVAEYLNWAAEEPLMFVLALMGLVAAIGAFVVTEFGLLVGEVLIQKWSQFERTRNSPSTQP